MSFPSTPRGSSEHGLFSSPTRSHSSPIAMQLTPRSKIQALLAADDDEDDDEDEQQYHNESDKENRVVSPGAKRQNTANVNKPPTHSTVTPSNAANPIQAQVEDEATDKRRPPASHDLDTRSDEVSVDQQSSDDDLQNAGLSAYERVKLRLMKEGATETTDHVQEEADEIDAAIHDKTVVPGSHSSDASAQATHPETHKDSQDVAKAVSNTLSLPRPDPLDQLFGSPTPSPRRREDQSAILRSPTADESGDDEAAPWKAPNSRLQQLLERRRRELSIEDEADSVASSTEQPNDPRSPSPKNAPVSKKRKQILVIDSDGDSDGGSGTKLTEQTRPQRKASKKAQEEMKRETQRLARNMQLTHEARTKVKFSKADLFAKLKFRQSVAKAEAVEADKSALGQNSSDSELAANHDTPPSSPPSLGSSASKPQQHRLTHDAESSELQADLGLNETAPMPSDSEGEDDILSLEDVLKKAVCSRAAETRSMSPTKKTSLPPFQSSGALISLKKFGKSRVMKRSAPDSDDDLQIIKSDDADKFVILDRLPKRIQHEGRSMHALRALANLNGHAKPGKHGQKTMSAGEMQVMLQLKVRQQTIKERDEKIEKLRAAGKIVQTAEEKEREQLQIDSMLERARREADELMKKERELAKRAGKGNEDDADHLPDSEGDDDWDGSEADKEDADDNSSGSEDQSGSEDEDAEDIEVNPDENDAPSAEVANGQAGQARDESCEEQGNVVQEPQGVLLESDPQHPHDMGPPAKPLRRHRRVVSDDEDDLEVSRESLPARSDLVTPAKSKAAAFGFSDKHSPRIGLSQVFLGTMADSQTQAPSQSPAHFETPRLGHAFGFQNGPPAIGLSQVFNGTLGESPTQRTPGFSSAHSLDQGLGFSPVFSRETLHRGYIVGDSQQGEAVASPTQSPAISLPSPNVGFHATQNSDAPEPTQDEGFVVNDSQASLAASYKTVATEPMSVARSFEEPPAARRGRLIRRRVIDDDSEAEAMEEAVENPESADLVRDDLLSTDAFDVMKRSSKAAQKLEAYNRKKSAAKDMVAEQAEESEDEYAGLGGVSDDDSADELDDDTKKIIDDEGNEEVNERKLAQLHAERQLADDEKHMQRLFTDVVGGGLRRRKGGMDLFDYYEDEDEQRQRSREMKQRKAARLRKALLADDKISQIADNPKRAAFLQAIADRDEEDDVAFLDLPEVVPESQPTIAGSGSQQEDSSNEQDKTSPSKKRKISDMQDADESATENNHHANPRRNTKITKPTSLADIRSTLSELVGLPASAAVLGFDQHEDLDVLMRDEDDQVSFRSVHPRRSNTTMANRAVIDRMAIKRGESSASAKETSRDRLAFGTSLRTSSASFKVPSLLRRATTNTSHVSESGAGEVSANSGRNKDSVKMGGSKKSSVNYYVREQEKKARLDEVEKKRNDERVRVGRKRGNGKALGVLAGGGSFD